MLLRAIVCLLSCALLTGSAVAQETPAKKNLLLLAQKPDGHPPQTHEYELGLKVVQTLLAKAPLDVKLVMADEPWRDGPELLAKADGAVLFLSEGAKWLNDDPKRLQAFRDLAKRRGGLSVIHWAMGTKDAKNIEPFVEIFGACHGGPDRKYKVLATEAHVSNPGHPVAQGLKDFKVRDEFYYFLKTWQSPEKAKRLLPILQADIDGNREMVAWAFDRPDGGRSFGFSGLHFHENWAMPEYRSLVTQGILWTMAGK